MATETITYFGSPHMAQALVRCLEEEGVRVDWTPPIEQRGVVSEAMTAVSVGMVARGATEAIKAGIKKFRERIGGKGEIEITDD